MYPPNTTLIITNRCNHYIAVLGEVKKFVVLENKGTIELGDYNSPNQTFTEEVVIKSSHGTISGLTTNAAVKCIVVKDLVLARTTGLNTSVLNADNCPLTLNLLDALSA